MVLEVDGFAVAERRFAETNIWRLPLKNTKSNIFSKQDKR
jgi:hypothetical protein